MSTIVDGSFDKINETGVNEANSKIISLYRQNTNCKVFVKIIAFKIQNFYKVTIKLQLRMQRLNISTGNKSIRIR